MEWLTITVLLAALIAVVVRRVRAPRGKYDGLELREDWEPVNEKR